ncbi:efflux system transcriptional repressor MexL [Acinetobacter puyangensis]|uniref:Transcriptional regulator, TetR family n=1 Tax=Acinetobacter puyangensis TaxID=1096779 RepID=A0A240EDD3_9GAMM|nr:TetR/AcrR family transcriptional regulator [Acinetobacter puyangensis]SNX46566.1 transcriptional regulator, TetR family [Acinetobacter puyangensis]
MQPRGLGRPKDLKKRQAILEAAKNLFLTLGYEGSSMDAIAQNAGVSKLTVYNHFHDKTQLFSAAIEMVCEQRLPKKYYEIGPDSNIENVLHDLGSAFLNMLYSKEAIELMRLMSSLVTSNVELVHLFYQSGPARTQQNMHNFFEQVRVLKLLDIENSQQCAELFLTLLTDCNYDRAIWQIIDLPTPEQLEITLQQRLQIFFKLYPKI